MRKIMFAIKVMALVLMALVLTGATTKNGYPACRNGPDAIKLYEYFLGAIVRQDKFAIEFYSNQGLCGPVLGGMEVISVLEQKDYWIKIRVQPPGDVAPVDLFTSKDTITK